MTLAERKILAEFAIHFIKLRYWMNEAAEEKRNLEQRESSFQELGDEIETAFELLAKLERPIEKGLIELAKGV